MAVASFVVEEAAVMEHKLLRGTPFLVLLAKSDLHQHRHFCWVLRLVILHRSSS